MVSQPGARGQRAGAHGSGTSAKGSLGISTPAKGSPPTGVQSVRRRSTNAIPTSSAATTRPARSRGSSYAAPDRPMILEPGVRTRLAAVDDHRHGAGGSPRAPAGADGDGGRRLDRRRSADTPGVGAPQSADALPSGRQTTKTASDPDGSWSAVTVSVPPGGTATGSAISVTGGGAGSPNTVRASRRDVPNTTTLQSSRGAVDVVTSRHVEVVLEVDEHRRAALRTHPERQARPTAARGRCPGRALVHRRLRPGFEPGHPDHQSLAVDDVAHRAERPRELPLRRRPPGPAAAGGAARRRHRSHATGALGGASPLSFAAPAPHGEPRR